MKEKVIIVDNIDNIIGYKYRNELSCDDIIRVSGIWIENEKGEILIAQRSFQKKHDPGKWGPAAAGTLEKGETYEVNILKEIKEEIGTHLTVDKLSFLGTFFEETSHKYFAGIFYARVNSQLKFFLQKEELENIRWINWRELEKEIKEKPEEYLLHLDRGILKIIKDWKNMEDKYKKIELRLQKIEERNKRVSLEKSWETSWTRRISILVITYIFIVTLMFIFSLSKPFVNAVIPALAYVLSIQSFPFIKRWWIKKQK